MQRHVIKPAGVAPPAGQYSHGVVAEAAQLLLSIIALCWFHLIHARTVAPAVGVTLENVEDLERRRRHIVGLVLHGLAGLERPLTSTLTQPSHD